MQKTLREAKIYTFENFYTSGTEGHEGTMYCRCKPYLKSQDGGRRMKTGVIVHGAVHYSVGAPPPKRPAYRHLFGDEGGTRQRFRVDGEEDCVDFATKRTKDVRLSKGMHFMKWGQCP